MMGQNFETSLTAPLVLCDERGGRHLVLLANGVARVAGAVLDVAAIRRSVGRVLAVGRRRFLVLPARTTDLLEGIGRGPQTIGSKDAGLIVLRLGLRSGMRVLEVAAGSGPLTIALATVVAPTGRVLAYERRPDVARLLRRNLALAGVDSVVDVREDDAGDRDEDNR